MVSVSAVLACVLTLLISLVLPVLIGLLFALKHKKQEVFLAWLLGAAGFFATQILIRLPVLSILSGQSWFLNFAKAQPFLYAFALAFTAGLVELAGRLIVARLLKKKMTWNRALAAGFGHGGIEAMLLTGMTYVNNLLYIVMINTGVMTAALNSGLPETVIVQLQSIEDALLSTPASLFLLAGLERLLAMVSHTAMSVIVCRGVQTGKSLKAALLCLGIHTLIDLTAGLSLVIDDKNIAYSIIYGVLTVVAALSVWILWKLRGKMKESAACEKTIEAADV